MTLDYLDSTNLTSTEWDTPGTSYGPMSMKTRYESTDVKNIFEGVPSYRVPSDELCHVALVPNSVSALASSNEAVKDHLPYTGTIFLHG
jgi:hypothetical protein